MKKSAGRLVFETDRLLEEIPRRKTAPANARIISLVHIKGKISAGILLIKPEETAPLRITVWNRESDLKAVETGEKGGEVGQPQGGLKNEFIEILPIDRSPPHIRSFHIGPQPATPSKAPEPPNFGISCRPFL